METKLKTPLIVAHRGAHKDKAVDENTLEAFAQAFTYNVDAIEGDFHLTSDTYILCHHNPTLQGYAIKEQPLNKLRQLKPDLPTLDKVLALVPFDKMIFIEIKCGIEIFEYLVPLIRASKLKQSQIVIISFNAEVIHQAKITYPQMQAYWLYEFHKDEIPSLNNIKKVLDVCQADGISTNMNEHIDKKWIDKICKSGYEYHVWTAKSWKIDSLDKIDRFKEWGIMSITMDDIDII